MDAGYEGRAVVRYLPAMLFSRRWLPFALGALGACTGDLTMLDAALSDGGGVADAGDLGARDLGPSPPVKFAPTIQRDLDALGCSAASACHGGAAPMHVVAGATLPTDLAANYAEVLARAMNGASSSLLKKPLLGSGTSHAGTQPFVSTSDPTWQRWLHWVEAGAPSGIGDPPDMSGMDAAGDGGGDGAL